MADASGVLTSKQPRELEEQAHILLGFNNGKIKKQNISLPNYCPDCFFPKFDNYKKIVGGNDSISFFLYVYVDIVEIVAMKVLLGDKLPF